MFVYVISAGEFQKIGITADRDSRLAALQGANPAELTMPFAVETARAAVVEKHAHWVLREQHARGEWFKVSVERAILAVKEAQVSVTAGTSVYFNTVKAKAKPRPAPDAIALWPVNDEPGWCMISTIDDAMARREVMDAAYRRIVSRK